MEEKKGIGSDLLKIIAFVTMIIDHTGIVFKSVMPEYLYYGCRIIGRLSFPIFAVFIVEGFLHTSNVKKYIIRMGIVALISELPFNLMRSGRWLYESCSNVLFTFVISLLVLCVFRWAEEKGVKERAVAYGSMALGMVTTYFLGTDYSWIGVLFIITMYCLRNMPEYKYICGGIILFLNGSIYNLAAPVAFVPIHFYNGKKGRLPKWATYAIYPLHMLLLGIIGEVVLNG